MSSACCPAEKWGVPKTGVPPIIHYDGILTDKQSISGSPIYGNIQIMIWEEKVGLRAGLLTWEFHKPASQTFNGDALIIDGSWCLFQYLPLRVSLNISGSKSSGKMVLWVKTLLAPCLNPKITEISGIFWMFMPLKLRIAYDPPPSYITWDSAAFHPQNRSPNIDAMSTQGGDTLAPPSSSKRCDTALDPQQHKLMGTLGAADIIDVNVKHTKYKN